MKMLSRIVLALLGIVLLAGGLFLILLTLGAFSNTGIVLFGYDFLQVAGNLSFAALGFIILIIGILLLAFSLTGSKKKKPGSVVNFTEMGDITISFRAIENMILRATQKVKGIREVNIRINSTEQGLIIYLNVQALPEIPIPGLMEELQKTVSDYVQQYSGINVAEVKVLVENITQEKIERNLR